jgi:hypothetical protein
MARSKLRYLSEAGGQSLENTTRRRSSLYQNAQAAGLYLNMAHGN